MMRLLLQKVHIPAMVVSAALQLAPMARGPYLNQALASSGFAIVFRWCAGAVALLGSYHAVSGATAALTGVQNLNPPGRLTMNATGTVAQTFAYRIIVSNPGPNSQQAFYNATPLPPGLTINTNVGGNGYITGKPTAAGVYSTKLTAGHVGFGSILTSVITITIKPAPGSTPEITAAPTNQTVLAGSSVAFKVAVTSSTPLAYNWAFAGAPISGATTSSLQLTNVQSTASGTYSVIITSASGSVSASATLTVLVPPTLVTQPQSLSVTNGAQAMFHSPSSR